LLGEDGRWLVVEDLLDTGVWELVYNLRITDWHTYFVGTQDWGFAVWAHNSYSLDDYIAGKDTAPAGLSTDLLAIRATLNTNPKARLQFDEKFAQLKSDPNKMEKVINNMTKGGGDLSARLESDYDKAHKTLTPYGPALSELQNTIRPDAVQLKSDAEAWATANPGVKNAKSLARRVQDEIDAIDKALSGEAEATQERAQGHSNNISGWQAELAVAQTEKDVIGLSQKFSLNGVKDKVEVDVVSENGTRWVESKNVLPFGLGSRNWKNEKDPTAGLASQVDELLEAAKEHPVGGVIPTVVVNFPKGVTQEVADAIRAKGAVVQGVEVVV
jgi:hypothetical protein